MITVACVLRSGGLYDPTWVKRLERGVAANLQERHRFVCLTDTPFNGTECVPLVTDWPRWWSKLELFRPGLLTGPTLYLDLDSIIVGPLADMVQCASGFRAVGMWPGRAGGICSTAMSWRGDFSDLFDRFAADPEAFMQIYDRDRPHGRIGDQAFIEDELADIGIPISHFDGLSVASFKDHARACPPAGCSVVAFHGRPKPADCREGWVVQAWR
ncbi:MAG: hypothetical protein ACU0CF_04695 [Sagittula sp.]|uniref:hypothetical protein n=1 Tax=Sagittula sp. TaxID=2038081 RepID=UPI00405845A2